MDRARAPPAAGDDGGVSPGASVADTASKAAPGVDDLLVTRYGVRRAQELLGRPPNRSRRVSVGRRSGALVGAVAGLGVLVGWVAWASAGHDPGSVGSQLVSFGPATAHEVPLVFTVTRPAGTTLFCVLDATNTEQTVVGRAVIRVPPSTRTTTRVHARVATVSTPLDVTVDGCQTQGGSGLH